MARHRELAQVVYAKTLGRESASRIWRTVVVAGAMLGAPVIVSAGDTAPPAKTEKAPAEPAKGIPPKAPATKAELAKQAAEVVKALAAEMVELDKKISASMTEVKSAKDQAARDTANATLKDQQKQKSELKAKQTAAKAEQKKADSAAKAEANANKPKPRPRTPEDIRPKGRGFILS
jgi:hypothetical protein